MRNSDGTFAEGNTGRKAGTPNKTTTEIKEAFQMLLEDNLPTLKRGQTPLVKKLHNVLLAVRHQVITMQDFENLIAEYPEVEKLTNKGKESKLNGTLLSVQFYNKGSLEFTVILSEGKFYKFKK